ncbi:hypothetical protein BV898_13789 [Hypsibius exemplaris]|uniref:Aftiphilin clathrin-binding box domain-containing protein n=1 Tax=Hypsibius exemplaris TaxID=2072580 RepID=A0A1W0W9M8_HYPEX|nr:hypothetical protein BV898_13789 [Hypsibius exemplaris]
MAEGYIPPRVSSSPPPFDADGFNDFDAMDSVEKDIASRPGFGDYDLESHEEGVFVQPPPNKSPFQNGFRTPAKPDLLQNGKKHLHSSEVTREESDNKHVTAVGSAKADYPASSLASASIQAEFCNAMLSSAADTPNPLDEDISTAALSTQGDKGNAGDAFDAQAGSTLIRSSDGVLTENSTTNLGEDSLQNDHDDAESLTDNSAPDVEVQDPTVDLVVDGLGESGMAGLAMGESAQLSSSVLTVHGHANSSQIVMAHETDAKSPADSAPTEEADFDEFSEWADFAGPSTVVTEVHSTPAEPTAAMDDANEDEWGEFSDFPTNAPAATPIPVALAFCAAISPKDLRVAFADTVVEAFPEQVESSLAITSCENIDLDRAPQGDSTVPFRQASSLWTSLKDLDETNALKFHWPSSSTRQAQLRSLNLSYLSAFTMQKKEPVPLNNARPSGGEILQPMKLDPAKPALTNGKTVSLHPEEPSQTEKFNNQLLDFLGPGTQSSGLPQLPAGLPADSKSPPTLIPKSIPPRSMLPVSGPPQHSMTSISSASSKTVTNGVTLKQKSDVEDVLARFRNLSFMQSKVLVAPPASSSSAAFNKVAKF